MTSTDTKKISVAILGATGAVGEAMIQILAERDFPVDKLYPLASKRSRGLTVTFKNKVVDVIDAESFDFTKADLCFFTAGGEVSKQFVPIALEAGCMIIDNTAAYRYEEDVPLIIPEINMDSLNDYDNPKLIANPNCSTIQMLVALNPIYQAVGIKRINVATYQSVSGSGKSAISELVNQLTALLNGRSADVKAFPKQIAFNVIPQIDVFHENGYTKEEMKMHWETQKIFGDLDIQVNATAVRVPVVYGHSEAINIETRDKITLEDAIELLKNAPGVTFFEDREQYPTAFDDAVAHDEVYIGRLREDFTHPHGLNLWVVADNVRKGGALNAIQIAEELFNLPKVAENPH